ncbi:MAG: OB-fold protein [Imperialibacter sp.]|uniref:OB-fold protein n=1 Tax=Imperialibacter sp. TaxID=2038411 RepID=UPI003A8BD565
MKNKLIKRGIIVVAIGLAAGVLYAVYLFNMPHRDVQASNADFELEAGELVSEYLANPEAANEKYLQEEGESKILIISGTIASIDTDMNNLHVVLLKKPTDKAGVSCTFMTSTDEKAAQLKVGQTISIKGVIRAGAGYDADLGLYENVILEKSDIVSK